MCVCVCVHYLQWMSVCMSCVYPCAAARCSNVIPLCLTQCVSLSPPPHRPPLIIRSNTLTIRRSNHSPDWQTSREKDRKWDRWVRHEWDRVHCECTTSCIPSWGLTSVQLNDWRAAFQITLWVWDHWHHTEHYKVEGGRLTWPINAILT